ncbi:short-chain acyl-CoA dehydrogenase [Thermosulfidibacter takaii ABI70S6]|uniref:Cyclohex-1-ene-1-carbonyl-CoA dehydrogenase n=1 Tax=Thermosulfidibacter takaii (strain DSM 17441 / JCM 13301 / NBRC 103674 / ABI70S6) TaxID=1298851 RepID=A0A0S3QU27_THET7|nr:acyl-CoA dehydrogenase family protein [Thermosulfidibacter takaii]BAT71814.1 short-chain acyl-CoA dehydrogenase [Thermosulfidibacter takaii ABI70S6]
MDFELKEEHRLLQNMVRDFAEKEIAPIAAKIDEEEIFPVEIHKKLAELGLNAITIPSEYGGSDMDTISFALAIMELGRVSASVAVTQSVTNMVAEGIYRFGNEEQKRKYLPKIASGEYVAASFALTEPWAGSDAGSIKTTAKREGDYYVLNGSKIFITSGAYAGVIMVAAVTDKTKGKKGISVFLVEQGTPGLTIGKEEKKMGQRGSNTVELAFEDCKVPAENLLGNEGDGFKIMLADLDGGRIGIGALACGVMRACLEEMVKYSKGRVQFGQPIANFQAIQWMIADTATELEVAETLVLRAAWLKDQFLQGKGGRFTKEASMAKLFATEAANRAAYRAVQVHGGYGYSREFPVERYYRDIRVTTIYEGTSEIQRLVIARNILG